MALLVELLKNELLAPLFQLSFLAELGVRDAVVEDIVEVEAMSVEKLDSVRITMKVGVLLLSDRSWVHQDVEGPGHILVLALTPDKCGDAYLNDHEL